MILVYRLPYPDRRLNPNSSCSLREKMSAAGAARDEAYYIAGEKGDLVKGWKGKDLVVHLTIRPPDKRPRDDDNVIAALKHYQDGIFKYLGLDDSKIIRRIVDLLKVPDIDKQGYVIYRLGLANKKGWEIIPWLLH